MREHRDGPHDREEEGPAPFVTISRQAGAGALPVAEELARHLTEAGIGRAGSPWAVFDKNLLEEVIEQHQLPEEFMKYIEDSVAPRIRTAMEELFNVPPSMTRLVGKTNRTILHLATMGSAIIVGRGAAVVTRELPGGLHVRLVGSPNVRRRAIMDRDGLTRDQAQAHMKEIDHGRAFYMNKYFRRDIDNALLYDLVLNTDRWDESTVAQVIGDALSRKLA
jgi:cytidylate kinase